MKSAIQRFFLVMMSAWLLVGHVGFAYRISDCLVTGKKKLTWAVPTSPQSSSSSKETRISRDECYRYAHIQVKFSFDQQIKKLVKSTLEAQPLALLDNTFSITGINSVVDREKPNKDFPYFKPLPERLALMQRYNI